MTDVITRLHGQTRTPFSQIEEKGITVRRADESDLERWNDFVSQADAAGPFHLVESLSVFADHSRTLIHPRIDTTARLHPLVGYKGEELVGILPVFEIEMGPLSAVFSPLPNFEIPYLGPATFAPESMKVRRRMKRRKRFVEGSLQLLDSLCDPDYAIVASSPQFGDIRPFIWSGYTATPRHTYVVDLSPGEEEILARFSKTARYNLTQEWDDYEIEEGGQGTIRRIIEQVAARHAEQDEKFLLKPEIVVDFYERLPDGVVRPYVFRLGGEFVGGEIVLEHGDVAFAWQGGVKADKDLPVNELLDWTAMRNAKERGRTRYDLLGANKHKLSEYKGKFGPDLETYYSLERSHSAMKLASVLYKHVR